MQSSAWWCPVPMPCIASRSCRGVRHLASPISGRMPTGTTSPNRISARIVGMLGGRAAEELVYGTKTTGAESDIEQATHLARDMVTRWGMSDLLGMVQLAPRENPFLAGRSALDGFGGSRPFSED